MTTEDTRNDTRTTLDFTRDQVMVGGIPKDLEREKLAAGWELVELTADRFVTAQYGRADGSFYFRQGQAAKGTQVLVPVLTGDPDALDRFGVIRMCGNPVILGEELYGW